jgi:hypothetical protein
MDGQYYLDTRLPHISTDIASVTLAATNKALYPVSAVPAMGKDYWTVGKAVRIFIFGRCTSAGTPGNLTLSLFYGTGADANGTSLAATAATAWTASQTNMSFWAFWDVHCTAIGSAGALFACGYAKFNESAIAAGLMMPATAPATTGSLDLTVASNILSVQALRSGSTAETMQLHKVRVTSLN